MNSDPCALHIQGFTHRLTGAQTGNNYFSSLSLVQANEKLAWSPNIALSVHYAPLWSTESKSSESEEVPGINLWFVNKCTCSGVETSHILILQVYLISTEKNNQHNQLIHISPQLLRAVNVISTFLILLIFVYLPIYFTLCLSFSRVLYFFPKKKVWETLNHSQASAV